MIYFFQHHAGLMGLILSFLLCVTMIAMSAYRKRDKDRPRPLLVNLLMTLWLGNLVALGGFMIGVLASKPS